MSCRGPGGDGDAGNLNSQVFCQSLHNSVQHLVDVHMVTSQPASETTKTRNYFFFGPCRCYYGSEASKTVLPQIEGATSRKLSHAVSAHLRSQNLNIRGLVMERMFSHLQLVKRKTLLKLSTTKHVQRTRKTQSHVVLTEAHMARSSLKNQKESFKRPALVFTDSDSLANTVKKDNGQRDDKRFRIVVSILREGFREVENTSLQWLPTHLQVEDPLTKTMERDILVSFFNSPAFQPVAKKIFASRTATENVQCCRETSFNCCSRDCDAIVLVFFTMRPKINSNDFGCFWN